MRIAYARVSTADQNLALQRDALVHAGYDQIFEDHGASGVASRPGLQEALDALSPGDTLIVWRLDRLARSMRELVDLVEHLHERQIGFHSLTEHIDISSAFGELVLHVLSAIAHFERRLIIERTRAGMAAAKARGVKFGRAPALDATMLEEAQDLIRAGLSVTNAATQIGVGRSTLYRYLQSIP